MGGGGRDQLRANPGATHVVVAFDDAFYKVEGRRVEGVLDGEGFARR